MNRRQFIKGSLLSATVIGVSGTGFWLNTRVETPQLTLNAVLQKIKQLSLLPMNAKGVWGLNQIFEHCAQSVEFSMIGFPEHKSALFKRTVGPMAFSAFKQLGEMHHALNEAIPGAALVTLNNANILSSLTRLSEALITFQQFQGELAPHFAFGELSKSDYEIAHALHFYNHLTEIEIINK